MQNKNILNIINKHFHPTAEHRAAYTLWLRGITSKELNKCKGIPALIKSKVMNELIELEKRP